MAAALIGGFALWAFLGDVVRSWRSAGNKPWETDTCALGRVEAGRYREGVRSIRDRERHVAASCAGDPSGHAACFGRLTLARVNELQEEFGGGMEGRLLALHALMRAGKAVLLSQASLPTPKPVTYEIFSPAARASLESGPPPPVPRADVLVYALDAREFDLPGPVWRSGRRGGSGGYRPGSSPTGARAIARFAVTLSDPGLHPDDDRDGGSVKEEADYMDAAWSDVTGDRERRYPPSSGPGDLNSTISLCPRRPAWLDTVVEPRPRGSAAAARRRLFQGPNATGTKSGVAPDAPSRP